MASKLYDYTPQELQNLLNESNSYADLLRKLGMSEHGANMTTLRKIIDEYNLDLSIINENRKNENLRQLSRDRKTPFGQEIPLNEILQNGTLYKSERLLKKLYKEEYKEKRCEICGIENWMGKEITFHLHHKDGNHYNNDLDNLQVLCPNCHSQTDNFAGKGACKTPKLSKEKEKKKAQRGISEDGQRFYDGYGDYKVLCPSCHKNFMNKDASQCRQCYEKERKIPKVSKDKLFEIMQCNTFTSAAETLGVDRDTVAKWYKYYIEEEKANGNIMINSDKAPTKEELKKQLYKFKSFAALGNIYGVTDNSIRKWCRKYNLPSHTKEIKVMTEEDWQTI